MHMCVKNLPKVIWKRNGRESNLLSRKYNAKPLQHQVRYHHIIATMPVGL